MAYEGQGGQQSLPLGATTLEKLRIEDETSNCSICHEKLNCSNDGTRLIILILVITIAFIQ